MVMVEDEIDGSQSVFYAIKFFVEAIMEINEGFLNQFILNLNYSKSYARDNGKDVAFNFSQAGKDMNDKLKTSPVTAARRIVENECTRFSQHWSEPLPDATHAAYPYVVSRVLVVLDIRCYCWFTILTTCCLCLMGHGHMGLHVFNILEV
ncbi:hypothetical protein KSS87_019169 [Heliosperma pusillum]|nr:hypothetical protein KSS87_019169 [Heliosperma pusillum]